MAETDLSIECPCCKSMLGFDAVGDVIILSDAPLADNQRRINSLIVEEVTPDWQLQRYHFNNQEEGRYRAPAHMDIAQQQQSAPVPVDETLTAAAEADLRERNISARWVATSRHSTH